MHENHQSRFKDDSYKLTWFKGDQAFGRSNARELRRCLRNTNYTFNVQRDCNDDKDSYEYLEDCSGPEHGFIDKEVLERVIIFDMSFINSATHTLTIPGNDEDDLDIDNTNDSIEIAKRRISKSNESNMKTLSNFRKVFAPSESSTLDQNDSHNTAGPPDVSSTVGN